MVYSLMIEDFPQLDQRAEIEYNLEDNLKLYYKNASILF